MLLCLALLVEFVTM